MKNSAIGILIGIVLIPGSVFVLAWNEYRTVHRGRALVEARQKIQTISNRDDIDSQLDQQLVHLSGKAISTEAVADPQFLVTAEALKIRRNVLMYQWEEEKKEETRDRVGGRRETKTTYSYRKTWSNDEIDSSRFEDSGHNNPKMKFPNNQFDAPHIKIGAYELGDNLKSHINNWEQLTVDWDKILSQISEAERMHFLLHDGQLYYSTGTPTPNDPQLGDLRIDFQVCNSTDVSVAGGLQGNLLSGFKTTNGESIEKLFLGTLSAGEIMDRMVQENNMMAWLWRLGGFIMCLIGFNLLLGPLVTLASVIPFLGRLTGGLSMIVSGTLALVVCAITIGIAWIAVRPLLGVGLLAVAGMGIFGLSRLRSKPSSLIRRPGDDTDVEVV